MWTISYDSKADVWIVWNKGVPSSRRIFTSFEEAEAYWTGGK